MARLRIASLLLLFIGLVVLLGLVFHQRRQLAEGRRQRDRDQESLRALGAALRERDLHKAPLEAEEEPPDGARRATLTERDATIARLNLELREVRANLSTLQGQLSTANDERQRALAGAEEQIQKQQTDWQGRLETLQKQLDAAEAQSEASRQRLAAVETEYNKLRTDRSDDSARSAQLAGVITGLQDLDRRRDVYLTSIMRRYRDITNQFRATSGMLDSNRDPNSNALSSATLTRIQNSISQTEDDLRQLNELNDQTHQLEKKLVKK
jgi:chromosome segregation ATPase